MLDVAVIGGSYAGLAAALQLGRARRSVLVLDAGQRRNRFVTKAHGILGFDGESPAVIAAKAKEQVLAYPSVGWRDAEVGGARVVPGGFAVSEGGDAHLAKRLILATGIVDEIPSIPGVAERWGKTVFHCPYCDGYETHRGRLGVLASGSPATHYAAIVSEWGPPDGTTLFVHDGPAPSAEELGELRARGIHVETAPIVAVRDAPAGIELRLRDGRTYVLTALFALPQTRLPGRFAERLGLAVETGPTGSFYKTDPHTKETTVAGIYAAGDAGQSLHSIAYAIADGARAGASAHQSLVFERGPLT